MASKIFCIGLSRTGTTALHEILQQLGFNSKHYVEELIPNGDLGILSQYDAVGDAPVPLLYRQLDERYPVSKFILTTRDKEQWLSSMQWMFRHGRVIWNWTAAIGDYHRKLYGCNRYKRKKLHVAFDRYHDEVREYFRERPADFLEINIDDGFDVDTICKFLDISTQAIDVVQRSDRRDSTPWEFVKYYLRFYFNKLFK